MDHMVQLLMMPALAECALYSALLFKTPLRDKAMAALDWARPGKGPLIVRTVVVAFVAVLVSYLHHFCYLRHCLVLAGTLSPSHQLLLSEKTLQATLIGNHALSTDRALKNRSIIVHSFKSRLDTDTKTTKN
ncbi:hypothetical protein RJ639_028708 [Escallonia herrerae]|uniref:Endoplasmic reticulum transmembrane protein n=1 Tax=Escallonia herrerae TaxID=1293975 RepID=A0AA88X8J3_9ASTE|nr:hypothetical protein RJ639_028708 [Escallonia herrerae]